MPRITQSLLAGLAHWPAQNPNNRRIPSHRDPKGLAANLARGPSPRIILRDFQLEHRLLRATFRGDKLRGQERSLAEGTAEKLVRAKGYSAQSRLAALWTVSFATNMSRGKYNGYVRKILSQAAS